jgi:hypothetical protein
MQPCNRTQRDGTSRGDAPEREMSTVWVCVNQKVCVGNALTRRRNSLTALLSKANCENNVAKRKKRRRNHVRAEFAPLPKTNIQADGGESAEHTPSL